MQDAESLFTTAALMKWQFGEAMSIADLERVIKVFETRALQTSQADQNTVAGLQMKMRDALRKYIEPPK